MRKVFIILFILTGIGFGWQVKKNLSTPADVLPKAEDKTEVKSDSLLSEIKKQIFTPGPLKSGGEQGFTLTRAGTINNTNLERKKQGLPELKENFLLDKAAQAKLKDMFQGQYFEHISPGGLGPSDFVKTAGYEYLAVGENLALGNYKGDADLVLAWMNSPGHKANILNTQFKEIGVAVGKGVYEGKETWLAVQEFGRPLSDCPSVNSETKTKIDSYRAELNILEQQIGEKKEQLEQNSGSENPEAITKYNAEVINFNSLVKIYNNKIDLLKQLINSYNSEIGAYNQCLGQ